LFRLPIPTLIEIVAAHLIRLPVCSKSRACDMVVNADVGATQASENYSSDGFLLAP
jgi:hypothetical protein